MMHQASVERAASAGLSRRAVSVVEATFGLVSNNAVLASNPEFFTEAKEIQSLLTDVYAVPEVDFTPNLDAYLFLLDVPNVPFAFRADEREVWLAGDLSRLDRKNTDRRYSVFGNLGVFFKYALATLERCHGIHSFHASALFRPVENDLLIVVGPPGAGKTVYLLEGINRGYRVFSTEMVHFRLDDNGCTFYKGALWDNIRAGNLFYSFPVVAERLKIIAPQVPDMWRTKVAVNLQPLSVAEDKLVNPTITIVAPRIEEGRATAIVDEITAPEKLLKLLFDNATEKIAGTTLLYGEHPIDGFDTPELMRARYQTLGRFVRGGMPRIARAVTILAGSANCMETL
jgi:hypothetical protein